MRQILPKITPLSVSNNLTTDTQYCRNCDVLFACYGDCPRNRFIATPDGEPGLNYLCAGYKLFYHHIDEPMKAMAGLLREGRYADEVMQKYAAKEKTPTAKTARNAACHCGSGKKYKHCHGNNVNPPSEQRASTTTY